MDKNRYYGFLGKSKGGRISRIRVGLYELCQWDPSIEAVSSCRAPGPGVNSGLEYKNPLRELRI